MNGISRYYNYVYKFIITPNDMTGDEKRERSLLTGDNMNSTRKWVFHVMTTHVTLKILSSLVFSVKKLWINKGKDFLLIIQFVLKKIKRVSRPSFWWGTEGSVDDVNDKNINLLSRFILTALIFN